MGIEQKVLTTPTFINGSLQPAGAIVAVNMDAFKDEDGNPAPDKNLSNLANIGEAPILLPTEVAAIAPTGPNPTMPQQVPPGSMQLVDGYAHGGALLVAQGKPGFEEQLAGAEAQNEGVEEEAVTRLSSTVQDSGTAGAGTNPQGTNGTETGALDEGRTFTADPYVTGTVDAADLSGLTAAQLDAVQEAEIAGRNRTGMLDKIETARRALDE